MSCRAVDFCFVVKSKALWWYRFALPNTRTLYMQTILYVYFCVRLQPAACLQPVCPVSHSELFSVTDGTWVVVHGLQTSRLAGQISSHTHRHQWRRPEVCGTLIRPCTPDKAAYTKHHVGQWQCLYTLRIMCRMPTCC